MNHPTTREHIIQAAGRLFYRQGYEHTSFADIADVVKISRGNFYHHFKSKDEILDAVIGRRLADTCKMLDKWEVEGASPEARIVSFINMLIANRADIKRHGCPVGTLRSELGKLDHAAEPEANELFTLFRTWLSRQFSSLGRKRDADVLAMHLLGRSQGVAALASAFQDEDFIREEVAQMRNWLKACARTKQKSAHSTSKQAKRRRKPAAG